MKTRNRRYKLTPQIQDTICNFIRAGGFPHVASEAAGIPRHIFDDWMRKGVTKRKTAFNTPFVHFREAVTQAKAQARLAAEVKAFNESPLSWLKQGPGKETPDAPGWTTTVKPQITSNNQINLLCTPELQGVFGALLQLLAPYPEARAAVAKALAASSLGEQPKLVEQK